GAVRVARGSDVGRSAVGRRLAPSAVSGVDERGGSPAYPPPGWGSHPPPSGRDPTREKACPLCQFRNFSSTAVRKGRVPASTAGCGIEPAPEPPRERSDRGQRQEELARGGDAERQVLRDQALVRRVEVGVGETEAGDDHGDSLVGER